MFKRKKMTVVYYDKLSTFGRRLQINSSYSFCNVSETCPMVASPRSLRWTNYWQTSWFTGPMATSRHHSAFTRSCSWAQHQTGESTSLIRPVNVAHNSYCGSNIMQWWIKLKSLYSSLCIFALQLSRERASRFSHIPRRNHGNSQVNFACVQLQNQTIMTL